MSDVDVEEAKLRHKNATLNSKKNIDVTSNKNIDASNNEITNNQENEDHRRSSAKSQLKIIQERSEPSDKRYEKILNNVTVNIEKLTAKFVDKDHVACPVCNKTLKKGPSFQVKKLMNPKVLQYSNIRITFSSLNFYS